MVGKNTWLDVRNSTFSGCDSVVSGGAIAAEGEEVTIEGSDFTRCSAGAYGGALISFNDTLVNVTSSTFDSCKSDIEGGAMFVTTPVGTVYQCRFINNQAGFTFRVVVQLALSG